MRSETRSRRRRPVNPAEVLLPKSIKRDLLSPELIQTKRVTFAAAATTATATWDEAFDDTNYTVFAQVEGESLYSHVTSKTASATTVTFNSAAATGGTVHFVAIHD